MKKERKKNGKFDVKSRHETKNEKETKMNGKRKKNGKNKEASHFFGISHLRNSVSRIQFLTILELESSMIIVIHPKR